MRQHQTQSQSSELAIYTPKEGKTTLNHAPRNKQISFWSVHSPLKNGEGVQYLQQLYPEVNIAKEYSGGKWCEINEDAVFRCYAAGHYYPGDLSHPPISGDPQRLQYCRQSPFPKFCLDSWCPESVKKSCAAKLIMLKQYEVKNVTYLQQTQVQLMHFFLLLLLSVLVMKCLASCLILLGVCMNTLEGTSSASFHSDPVCQFTKPTQRSRGSQKGGCSPAVCLTAPTLDNEHETGRFQGGAQHLLLCPPPPSPVSTKPTTQYRPNDNLQSKLPNPLPPQANPSPICLASPGLNPAPTHQLQACPQGKPYSPNSSPRQ